MGKMLSYGGVLGTLYLATDENMQRELNEMVSSITRTADGITTGMNTINNAIDDLANPYRISFKLGGNQLSLKDVYIYFANKVNLLWNSGETLKVILAMLMIILGVIALIVSPVISTILYIKNGIKDRSNFINGLRIFLLQVGVEASVGIVAVLLFVKFISL